jgi:16S rRNA (guanine(966)-N(2))-methyltransferase RsmD
MVPGDSTRPITDRVKENLFNILGDWVIGTYWLDLFAGTGQVGIEALSRGATGVDFVDNSAAAIRTIHSNLRHTRLEAGSKVVRSDAFVYLDKGNYRPYDAIFVAPPQYQEIWLRVLKHIDNEVISILSTNSQVIVQIDPSEFVDEKLTMLHLQDQRKYGRTMLCFFTPID